MSGKTEQKLEGQRATRDFSAEFKSKREQWKIMEGQHVWKKKIVVLKSMRVLKNINKKWLKPKKCAHKDVLNQVQRELIEQIKHNRDEQEEQALRKRERDELEARIRQRPELRRERDE